MRCYVGAMHRKYEYRRCLPHYQKDKRALFITFSTWHRWFLPPIVRHLALEACIHADGSKCTLHAAVIMPDHVHLICTSLADERGPFQFLKLRKRSRANLLIESIRP